MFTLSARAFFIEEEKENDTWFKKKVDIFMLSIRYESENST